ncbi:MAG: Fe-S cluster assembly protein SufD [Geodermatophilaceae bacterium]|nr:Fe-S cluster assembly protein SufD [Geodermatophilaceae bacterium]
MSAVDTVTEFPPLPSFKGQAGWEFTPLGKLDVDAHAAAPGGDAASATARQLFTFADAVGVANGEGTATSEGPVILSLAEARERHPDIVARHLGSIVKPSPLVARNDAQWTDGAFVYVPRNVHVEAPIHLAAVHAQAGTTLHTRTLVVLEDGAQAEVWDELLSADDDVEGIVNAVVELSVGKNARLRYVGAQDLNERTTILGTQRAIVAADGHLDWITLGFGAKLGKVFLETKLDGRGAHASVTGAYATHARQHLDFDTLQEHAAANTTSDLAFRGILDGRSRTVWRGMIQVDPDAQQTDAFQESRNLLLGGKAHADAIPGLEILADDVRCTHAAAIAKIDAEQLFYLRSRGLSEGTAHRLVVEGFLQALVERFEEGPVREAVAGALDTRLAAVLN